MWVTNLSFSLFPARYPIHYPQKGVIVWVTAISYERIIAKKPLFFNGFEVL